MASLQQESKGHWRIKFTDGHKGQSIRLGFCDKKSAQTALAFIERLIATRRLAVTPDGETIGWMNRLDDTVHRRLVRAGLATPRESNGCETLKQLTDKFTATTSCKDATAVFYSHTVRNLLTYFTNRPLNAITAAAADDFRVWMAQDQNLAIATVARRVIACRTIWNKAIRWGMAKENPFTGVKAGLQANEARKQFVPAAKVQQILDNCPDPQWRLIIACSRFGGLRIPSEIMTLRWQDIHWNECYFTVRSPKTEHHAGGASRSVPLFPEIRRELLNCKDHARPADEYVITGVRRLSANLRTQFERIAKRAGVKVWPKPFHNMRASRQSELMADYGLSTACQWLGNSPVVAARHYAMATDRDGSFQRAIGELGELGEQGAPEKALQKALQFMPEQARMDVNGQNVERENKLEMQGNSLVCTGIHNQGTGRYRIRTCDLMRVMHAL